jgi:hypothetical protein
VTLIMPEPISLEDIVQANSEGKQQMAKRQMLGSLIRR